MSPLRFAVFTLAVVLSRAAAQAAEEQLWVEYPGGEGPGAGKHIVLISGDEEYRSEEALPQLGKILSKHHGFRCTVLFSVNPETGEIDPNYRKNTPGIEALESADLMVLALRFRELPDDQMKFIDDYLKAGKPIVGLRTSTHAFNRGDGAYGRYHWQSKEWEGGFGRQILGETWISHHGAHGRESTRGIPAPGKEDHPILRGIEEKSIWGPTDVYGVRLPLPGDSDPLVLGAVLTGMNQDDAVLEGKKNDPMMPVAWTKTYETENGVKGRVFTSTMGSSTDLLAEGTRRMLVNACYWALGMEEKIPEKSNVEIVGAFEPSPFKFNGAKKGVKPSDHRME